MEFLWLCIGLTIGIGTGSASRFGRKKELKRLEKLMQEYDLTVQTKEGEQLTYQELEVLIKNKD